MESAFVSYSERAQRAILLAQEEARMMRAATIHTGHLLLGLLRAGGRVAKVLERHGITLDGARDVVRQHTRSKPKPKTVEEMARDVYEQTPFSPTANRIVLKEAAKIAESMGDEGVGTDHMLLALLQEEHGVAAKVFRSFFGDQHSARAADVEAELAAGAR